MTSPSVPVVTLALDHDRAALAAAARAGEMVRVRRGAYCLPGAVRDDGPGGVPRDLRRLALARIRAVSGQLRAEAVFARESAALLLGCRVWSPPTATHVYQRYRPSGRAAADVRRHAWTLTAEEITAVAGIPVTSLVRTVVDCARSMTPLGSLVITDSALGLGLRRETLLDALDRQVDRRGVRRARRVIECADGGAQSAWETWVRYEMLCAGLPRPTTQMEVSTDAGRFHTDLGYERWALGIEFDGRVKYRPGGVRLGHDPATEYMAEKERAEAIRRAGVAVERFTAADRRDVRGLLGRITGHLPPEVVAAARPDPLLRGR